MDQHLLNRLYFRYSKHNGVPWHEAVEVDVGTVMEFINFIGKEEILYEQEQADKKEVEEQEKTAAAQKSIAKAFGF